MTGHSSSVAVPALKALKALLIGNPRNQADFQRMYALELAKVSAFPLFASANRFYLNHRWLSSLR